MEDYQQKVYSTAINIVQDHGIAEDIAQEVFITIFKNILSFNQKSTISTWLYRITVNKSLDYLRAQKRHKRWGTITGILSINTGEPIKMPTTFDHPGILLEQKENARFLFAAIKELPENQKTVFFLAQVEDLPQKEIAEILGVSVKAVESLLQRAKSNLRKKLANIYERRNLL